MLPRNAKAPSLMSQNARFLNDSTSKPCISKQQYTHNRLYASVVSGML